ncbi:glycosyltransferase family 39 protein [Sutterella sp.]|uniref:ArnT family glycosyltransferase n=1 Tax=Sutterella sp. TaxID=1981025 RepID=UPI0026E0FD98|nr:hypothetical protein [Sutterella sp.]MDO5532796.1 hypothetical protein [Sutterella sp.]
MLTQRPTPAFLSQEAARRLPRYALLLLLAAFILSGLASQDLWTLRDAETFGIALEMVRGGAAEWLMPQIAGEWVTSTGPLPAWIAAVFMKCFSGLAGDVGAYRLTSLLWFAISTAAIWYGSWRLARRQEAQPVVFAFGGEAAPKHYGRAVADCAVLFFVATFGILARQHEPVPGTVLLSLAAVNLFGLAMTLRRPCAGAFVTGVTAGLTALTTSVLPGLVMLGAAVTIHAFARTFPSSRDRRILCVLAGAVLPAALWAGLIALAAPEAGLAWLREWAVGQAQLLNLADVPAILWMSRTTLWFLLPAWPLALWALYSWRRQLDRTHILVPATLVIASAVGGLFTTQTGAEPVLLVCVPGLSLLAAFGLTTLRRDRENLLDWFAISIFSVTLIALWLYWIAAGLDFPPKMARSIEMLSPTFDPEFGFGPFMAIVSGLLWIVFVAWRLTHRPVVIWRGPWLAAAGMTATAVTFLGLWHPAVDLTRSYAPIAREAALEARDLTGNPDPLVNGDGLPGGVRALFAYYGPVHFTSGSETSSLKLVRVNRSFIPAEAVTAALARPHTDETFYLVTNSGH